LARRKSLFRHHSLVLSLSTSFKVHRPPLHGIQLPYLVLAGPGPPLSLSPDGAPGFNLHLQSSLLPRSFLSSAHSLAQKPSVPHSFRLSTTHTARSSEWTGKLVFLHSAHPRCRIKFRHHGSFACALFYISLWGLVPQRKRRPESPYFVSFLHSKQPAVPRRHAVHRHSVASGCVAYRNERHQRAEGIPPRVNDLLSQSPIDGAGE
jgi:hypothetical protein